MGCLGIAKIREIVLGDAEKLSKRVMDHIKISPRSFSAMAEIATNAIVVTKRVVWVVGIQPLSFGGIARVENPIGSMHIALHGVSHPVKEAEVMDSSGWIDGWAHTQGGKPLED